MAEKNVITLDCAETNARDLTKQLREVRALIVRLIGSATAESYTGLELSNALYTLQFLTEDATLKDA